MYLDKPETSQSQKKNLAPLSCVQLERTGQARPGQSYCDALTPRQRRARSTSSRRRLLLREKCRQAAAWWPVASTLAFLLRQPKCCQTSLGLVLRSSMGERTQTHIFRQNGLVLAGKPLLAGLFLAPYQRGAPVHNTVDLKKFMAQKCKTL